MTNKGLKPTFVKSKKHYSTQTFGAAVLPELPKEYLVDNGYFDAQEGTPMCTGEAVADTGFDQDGVRYSVEFQYAKSLQLLNLPPNTAGIDLKTAMSVAVAIGQLPFSADLLSWRKDGQEKSFNWQNWPDYLDKQASFYKKAAYFFLEGPYDHFDNIRSVMHQTRDQKRSVLIGTPWYAEYEGVESSGIPVSGRQQISWHATAIKGWKVINGETYLMCKSWQGPNFGDHGWIYFSRAEINMLMGTPGSIGGMIAKTANEIKTLQIGTLEQMLGLCQLVITKMSLLAALLFPPKNYLNG